MLCTSLQELNELAQSKLDEQLEKNGSLTHHFTLLKFTLQHAAKARQERDPEKTYLFLVMYMILVLRKLPAFEDELRADEKLVAEFLYNKGKVKKVKKEVEKFRDYLQRLYEQDDDDSAAEDDDASQDDSDDAYEYHQTETTHSPPTALPSQHDLTHDSAPHSSTKRKSTTTSSITPKPVKPKVRPLPGVFHSFGSPLTNSPSTFPTTPTTNNSPIPKETTLQSRSRSTSLESSTKHDSASTRSLARGMQSLMLDEKMQTKVVQHMGNVAADPRVQETVGKGLGLAGKALSQAATNRDLQKKAAKGLLTVGKGSLKASVWAGKIGVKGAELYLAQQKEEGSGA